MRHNSTKRENDLFEGLMTPASKADSKALVGLGQAFKDHVHDEERRFDEIAKMLSVINGFAPQLARIEVQLNYNGTKVDELVVKVGAQNGRIGKLERWRSWMLGVLLIVGGLAGYVVEHIIKTGIKP